MVSVVSVRGVDVGEEILLVAIGCARLPGILDIAVKQPIVVFGTMDGQVLADLSARNAESPASAVPVYFYETG